MGICEAGSFFKIAFSQFSKKRCVLLYNNFSVLIRILNRQSEANIRQKAFSSRGRTSYVFFTNKLFIRPLETAWATNSALQLTILILIYDPGQQINV